MPLTGKGTGHLNYEFKAKAADINLLQKILEAHNPEYIGEDHQVDTYFNVPQGRLKLREGNIENALIYYERPDTADAKRSDVILYPHTPQQGLKDILVKVHGVKAIVDKKRKIYFIGNVKFHFDTVATLGSFVEVEAIDRNGEFGLPHLMAQCKSYAELFNIRPADYISVSYCDLVATAAPQTNPS